MPDFLITATDNQGNPIKGTITALDMGEAVQQVTDRGFKLLNIELAQDNITQAIPVPISPTAGAQPPVRPDIQPNIRSIVETHPREVTVAMDPIQSTTQMVTPPAIDLLKADTARRMKLEQDLTAMGMSADEIRRLVNASSTTFESDPNSPLAPTALSSANFQPGKPTKASKKVSADTLHSFAAELASKNAAKTNANVREVELGLPEFRSSTVQETIQSEALLRDASMLRRKEKFKDAEFKTREAINLTPSDPGALELLGDVLQGVGRVDEAMAAYKRAVDSDPKRASAERKYGDLLMNQQQWSNIDPEAVPPNRWLNSILSLMFPGVGQVYNGDWAKAVVFFCVDIICIYLLFYSPLGIGHRGLKPTLATLFPFALTFCNYIVALVDSNITASRKATE